MRTTYVLTPGYLVNRRDANDRISLDLRGDNQPIACPMYYRDMPEHEGPSGRMIGSRSEYREELKRTDTVPMERGMRGESPGYVDDRFAKANHKKSTQKAKDLFAQERKDTLAAAGLNDDMSSKPITAHIQFPS